MRTSRAPPFFAKPSTARAIWVMAWRRFGHVLGGNGGLGCRGRNINGAQALLHSLGKSIRIQARIDLSRWCAAQCICNWRCVHRYLDIWLDRDRWRRPCGEDRRAWWGCLGCPCRAGVRVSHELAAVRAALGGDCSTQGQRLASAQEVLDRDIAAVRGGQRRAGARSRAHQVGCQSCVILGLRVQGMVCEHRGHLCGGGIRRPGGIACRAGGRVVHREQVLAVGVVYLDASIGSLHDLALGKDAHRFDERASHGHPTLGRWFEARQARAEPVCPGWSLAPHRIAHAVHVDVCAAGVALAVLGADEVTHIVCLAASDAGYAARGDAVIGHGWDGRGAAHRRAGLNDQAIRGACVRYCIPRRVDLLETVRV